MNSVRPISNPGFMIAKRTLVKKLDTAVAALRDLRARRPAKRVGVIDAGLPTSAGDQRQNVTPFFKGLRPLKKANHHNFMDRH